MSVIRLITPQRILTFFVESPRFADQSLSSGSHPASALHQHGNTRTSSTKMFAIAMLFAFSFYAIFFSNMDFRMSAPTVTILTTLLTAVWAYFWYLAPGQPMRNRRVQTWWQLGAYIILFVYGIWRAYEENLITVYQNINEIWKPSKIENYYTRLYFEFETSWYISSLICTLINRESKDFWAMFIHHIITPITVYGAWHYNDAYAVVGVYVMVLHDISDVFLHSAKAFHHENVQIITDIVFVTFAVVFFITRLVLLPMVPWAYFISSPYGLARFGKEWWGDCLCSSLVILVCLHSYWFSLILQMIIKFAKKGNVEGDIRDPTKDAEMNKEKKIKRTQITNGN